MKLARNRTRTGTQVWVNGSQVVFPPYSQKVLQAEVTQVISFSSFSVFNKGLIEKNSLSSLY